MLLTSARTARRSTPFPCAECPECKWSGGTHSGLPFLCLKAALVALSAPPSSLPLPFHFPTPPLPSPPFPTPPLPSPSPYPPPPPFPYLHPSLPCAGEEETEGRRQVGGGGRAHHGSHLVIHTGRPFGLLFRGGL